MNYNFGYSTEKHTFANIELDALLSQNITLTNVVSEHPLEDGTLLNDAIHNQPLELSFSAVISDMPQTSLESLSHVYNVTDSLLSSNSIQGSKSLKAWRELYNVWKSKVLVSISTPLQSDKFEDMAIKNIVVTLDDTESLNFSVKLKRLDIIENLKKSNNSSEVGKQSVRT